MDPAGCHVIAGDWLSLYDGLVHTDPAELEIDHVVALEETWDSGAWAWGPDRLFAQGNDLDDPRGLRAVTAAGNGDKGGRDPSNWLPPDPDDLCRFLGDWIAIKARWALTMDESEAGRIRNLLNDQCPSLTVAPWPSAPTGSPPTETSLPTSRPVLPQGPESGGGCDPFYPTVCIPPPPPDLNCVDTPYRRFVVLPADPHRFDGEDDDGIGYETD